MLAIIQQLWRILNSTDGVLRVAVFGVLAVLWLVVLIVWCILGYWLYQQYARGPVPTLTTKVANTPATALVVAKNAKIDYLQIGKKNRMRIKVVNNNFYGDYVRKNEVELISAHGGHALVDVYIVYLKAAWMFGLSTFEDPEPVNNFFRSTEFLRDYSRHQALICVGLASWLDPKGEKGADERGEILSENRARTLCRLILQEAGNNKGRTALFGFGLGRHLPGSDVSERDQRSILVLGVRDATGDLNTQVGRDEIISQMLTKGFPNFNPGAYIMIAHRLPLVWIQIHQTTRR